jgi:hypothetical protein
LLVFFFRLLGFVPSAQAALLFGQVSAKPSFGKLFLVLQQFERDG